MKEHSNAALALLRIGTAAACCFVHVDSLWIRVPMFIGAAMVAFGVFARWGASILAAGWGVALAFTLRGTAWYLAPVLTALFTILFAAVAVAGPGRFVLIRTAVALLIVLPCLSANAQERCVSHPGEDSIEIVSNKPFINVRINGSEPERFMLDTGSNASLIDPALARSQGFHAASANQGFFGVGNQQTSLTRLTPDACLEMAGAAAEGVPLLGFDLSPISSVEGVPVRGTVGGEFLRRFVVVIDYAHARVRVLDRSFEYRGDGVVLPITIDGQIFTTVRIHRSSGEIVEGKFYVDTGTRTALSLNSPFVSQHRMLEGESAIPIATLGFGMGGESVASVFRVPEIELSSLHLRNVVVTASHDTKGVFADPNVAGIIGGELLRKFTLILDYPHRRVILERTAESDTPFGYDASGVFLIAEGRALDRIRILRVIAGSPAEEAGLQKDDVIEAIDGRPAHRLENVRRAFSRVHQKYQLRIRRGTRTFDAELRTVDLLRSPKTVRELPRGTR